MKTNELVKRNISGMQVIKTLQLLLEDDYTMAQLIEKLNANEKESIFNNSVVSKYINTCRYCGIDIPKIQNKYFVAKLPFGLNLSKRDIELIEKLQMTAVEKLTNKPIKELNSFLNKINKFSNKNIIKVEKDTLDLTKEYFYNSIEEEREVLLLFRTKEMVKCKPLDFVVHKGKNCFKVLYDNKVKNVIIDRLVGLKILGKYFKAEAEQGLTSKFKVTGALAERYSMREHEEQTENKFPEYILITNHGEAKDELFSRLLRYGKHCEVTSPQSYRYEMKSILDEMLVNYGEK